MRDRWSVAAGLVTGVPWPMPWPATRVAGGAALAIPVVQAAAKILREMATFEQATIAAGHAPQPA